tara:strand:+ start:866 stop:1747 length:882 start_codon:yes stop_codon:yes gene_type:complete
MLQFIAPVLTIGASIYSGIKSSNERRAAANASNEATERQFEYDTLGWEMAQDKLIADREYAIQQITANAQNEKKIADFRDAQNLQQYDYNLRIRNQEQHSLNKQFDKSNILYDTQLSLNNQSAEAARVDEYNRHLDVRIEAQYNERDAQLKALRDEGTLRARGMKGRSIAKGIQATYADLSRQLDMIDATVESSGRTARAVVEEISRDHISADLAAYAQKMLDPGELPMPIAPIPTPLSNIVLPRALDEYDFGPAPVRGAMATPQTGQIWGTAISNVASAVPDFLKAGGWLKS